MGDNLDNINQQIGGLNARVKVVEAKVIGNRDDIDEIKALISKAQGVFKGWKIILGVIVGLGGFITWILSVWQNIGI